MLPCNIFIIEFSKLHWFLNCHYVSKNFFKILYIFVSQIYICQLLPWVETSQCRMLRKSFIKRGHIYDLVKKDIIINKSINTTAAAAVQFIALFSPTMRVGLYISGWFDCISPFNTILSQRS